MKRLVGTIVALLLVAFVVLIPAMLWGESLEEDEPVSEPTSITSYVADFDIDDEGDMSVVETLTVDFPIGGRHGIFRFFDKSDASALNARRIPRDIAVTMDGGDVPVEISKNDRGGRYVLVRIGDPNSTVSTGEHVYEISYEIDGVLEEGTTGADTQFYWNLIPSGWLQPIQQSDLTVHLPVPAEKPIQCAVGAGQRGGCKAEGAGTDTLHVQTGALSPNTPVTIKVGLDMSTPAPGKELPWRAELDPVLGTNVFLLGLVLVLSVGAGLLGFVLVRRTDESDPQFPLMYTPPEGIGPAQAAYLVTEEVDTQQYVATLMYAADKGAIDLDHDGAGWTITDKNGAQGWAGLDEVTSGVAHLLGGPGTSFAARPNDVEGGKRLKNEIASFESDTRSWASGAGLMETSGLGGKGTLVIIGAFILVPVIAFWNPLNMSAIALIPGLFAVFGAGMARATAATRRTRAGRDVWSKAGGFRRILSTPSAEERFDFSGRKELYTAYIPWAVAFGCADEWAGKYRIEVGEEPPVPTYFGHAYTGAYAGSAVSSMVDSFESTVSSAISSYEATQKSSSSSSGGGGFSGGGGGGGGGGGSW
ncbi:DUF2207 domain-containing protein [Nocardioides sp. SR21]|uniref:DUF2207 domain-containing protein n=1 Tax=Nocardioides sp. SR21 TaxID=2919501 RepID=UPI001FA9DC75|nr:DUF2207 domain-containing protein [Nocardioides sp. SR21]